MLINKRYLKSDKRSKISKCFQEIYILYIITFAYAKKQPAYCYKVE